MHGAVVVGGVMDTPRWHGHGCIHGNVMHNITVVTGDEMTHATSTRWTGADGVTWQSAREYAESHGYDVKSFVRHVRKTGIARQPFGEKTVWVVDANAVITMPTGGTRGLANGYRLIARFPVVNGKPDPVLMQYCIDHGVTFRDPGAERRAGRAAMTNGDTDA